jgi:hypothetical protein
MNFQINPTMVMLIIYGIKKVLRRIFAVLIFLTSTTAKANARTFDNIINSTVYLPVKIRALTKLPFFDISDLKLFNPIKTGSFAIPFHSVNE